MSLSRISTASFRSRLAQTSSNRSGPNGFHHNPQDFSNRPGTELATRQTLLNKHWHYLPSRLMNKVESLSTSFRGVPIDKSGQMGLGFA